MPSLRRVASIGFALTLTTALLLTTVPCSAQALRGGIKAGAVFTSLSNIFVVTEGDEEESSVHTNAVYGGFVEWTLAPLWSFRPEVLVTSVGADLPDASLGDAIVIRYLEFPLLFASPRACGRLQRTGSIRTSRPGPFSCSPASASDLRRGGIIPVSAPASRSEA